MERDCFIKKIFVCFALFLMLMLPSTALASDWPGSMKDVFNTGVTGDIAPVNSPDENSWAFEMMDMGMNTVPVIVDGVVYTVSSNGFSAVELESGVELWNVTDSVGYALSNPVYGDGVIFAGSGGGKFYAFDTVSRSSWNVDVSRNMINAPVLYEDHRLYFGDTKDWAGNDGTFYCFPDNGSSTPIWARPASNGRGYYKVGAVLVGDYLVYGDNGGNLTSVNKADGSTVDEVNLNELFNEDIGGIWAGVTYDAEYKRLYTSSGNSANGGYCLSLEFDPESGTFSESVKESVSIGSSTSTPAIYGDRVYVGTGGIFSSASDRLLCLNRTTLDKIWEYSPDGAVQSSPSLSTYYDDGDGEVYIYFTTNSKTGSLYCLQDNASGTSPVEKFIYDGEHADFVLGDVALSNGWAVFGNNGGYLIGATTAEALEGADSSQVSDPTVLLDTEVTLKSETFSYVPAANQSASYTWDRLTDLGALAATGLEFETGDLSSGSFWITSMGGIENEAWGPGAKSWSIFINGKSSSEGLGGNSLKNGDVVTFYYLPWNQTTFEPIVEEAAYKVEIRVNAETDGWYQFHKDAANTGFSSSEASDTNSLLWVSDPLWAVESTSPVIANGKVFVKCGVDHAPNPMLTDPDELRVVALDEFTGDSLFSYGIGSVSPNWGSLCYGNGEIWYGQAGALNGGATVAAGKVFDSDGQSHHYYCTDAETGVEKWSFTVEGCGKATPAYWDGKVVFTSGPVYGAGNGHVYCVDAESGEEIWNLTLDLRPPTGSPAISNGVIYLTSFNGEILALDMDSEGVILWNQTIQGGTSSTPAIAYGNVYVSGGYPGSARTFCFNATDGAPVWSTSEEENIGGWTSSVAVADNKVFVGKHVEDGGNYFGHVTTCALNATTGESVWNAPYGGSSPAIADGIVFTIGADGRVYAFANPEELDIDYSVPETDLPLDAEVLPAVSIEINSMALGFGTLTPGESSSVSLSLKNAGKADVKLAPGLSTGSGQLFEDCLFFGSTPLSAYSKTISSQESEDVEVVLNVPADYGGALGVAEGKLIFWVEAA